MSLTRTSKFLSLILRHKPEVLDMALLEEFVKTDDKPRRV